jgi:hypothetical protein
MMTKDEAKILLGALQMLEGLIKPQSKHLPVFGIAYSRWDRF